MVKEGWDTHICCLNRVRCECTFSAVNLYIFIWMSMSLVERNGNYWYWQTGKFSLINHFVPLLSSSHDQCYCISVSSPFPLCNETPLTRETSQSEWEHHSHTGTKPNNAILVYFIYRLSCFPVLLSAGLYIFVWVSVLSVNQDFYSKASRRKKKRKSKCANNIHFF